MKKRLVYFIPAALLFLSGCSAQKKNVIKIHAYSQAVIPGIIPAGIDENGNKVRNEYSPKKNYLVYIENLKSHPVTITEMWIDSLHYSVKTEKVTTIPLTKIRFNEYDRTDTLLLVPATSHDVYLVMPHELNEKRIPADIKTKNPAYPALTIGYLYKEKKYYTRVEKFMVIPPDITQ